jgi:hypothetical protein
VLGSICEECEKAEEGGEKGEEAEEIDCYETIFFTRGEL